MTNWKYHLFMSAFLALHLERTALMAAAASRSPAFLPSSAARQTPTISFFHLRPKASTSRQTFVSSSNNNNSAENEVEATWTYVPYDPAKANRKQQNFGTQQPRRQFSAWQVPKRVQIPEDRLEISFVRSSGSGGQNVNKLSTKVELRFHVMQADWMPREVRDRLSTQQANRINKEGYMTLSSQEHRTQGQNRKAAVDKLKALVLEAWPRPKIRKQRKGISKAEKERRKDFKRKRSETKKNRKKVDW